MQLVTQQFCLQGSPGALCNTDSSPGYPVIQKGEQDLLDLPLPFHIYLPIFLSPTSSSHVPWGFFGRKYGYVDKEGSRHAPTGPLPSEKWMIRASGCTGAVTCLTAHTLPPATPSAIAGLCTLSATFLFAVHGRVRIHYASSLCSQTKINYF